MGPNYSSIVYCCLDCVRYSRCLAEGIHAGGTFGACFFSPSRYRTKTSMMRTRPRDTKQKKKRGRGG